MENQMKNMAMISSCCPMLPLLPLLICQIPEAPQSLKGVKMKIMLQAENRLLRWLASLQLGPPKEGDLIFMFSLLHIQNTVFQIQIPLISNLLLCFKIHHLHITAHQLTPQSHPLSLKLNLLSPIQNQN